MENAEFETYENDIIQIPDKSKFKIDDISRTIRYLDEYERDYEEIIYIYLVNMETDEDWNMTADEFFKILDEEDVTILQNQSCMMFMNEEEKENIYNHPRMI